MVTRTSSVAPLAGAWIEMAALAQNLSLIKVAPLAGAWIEIAEGIAVTQTAAVAPLAGAWIEILLCKVTIAASMGRTPRGCVD